MQTCTVGIEPWPVCMQITISKVGYYCFELSIQSRIIIMNSDDVTIIFYLLFIVYMYVMLFLFVSLPTNIKFKVNDFKIRTSNQIKNIDFPKRLLRRSFSVVLNLENTFDIEKFPLYTTSTLKFPTEKYKISNENETWTTLFRLKNRMY